MTRECYADCYITVNLDPKLSESTKKVFCVVAGLALPEISGLGELIEPGVTAFGIPSFIFR